MTTEEIMAVGHRRLECPKEVQDRAGWQNIVYSSKCLKPSGHRRDLALYEQHTPYKFLIAAGI